MLYRLAADAVVVLHFAFVLFVVLGGLPCLRWPRWAWIHLPTAAWGMAIEVFQWVCPLTYVENDLRRAAGEAGYEGGFVEEYVLPVLYPPGLDRPTQWVLAGLVLGVNAVVYGLAWRRHRARSAGSAGGGEG